MESNLISLFPPPQLNARTTRTVVSLRRASISVAYILVMYMILVPRMQSVLTLITWPIAAVRMVIRATVL